MLKIIIVLYNFCKKTPNTALRSFLKQSFTISKLLISKISQALSLTFSYQSFKKEDLLVGISWVISFLTH